MEAPLSPNVELMHLLVTADTIEEAQKRIDAALAEKASPLLVEVRRLFAAHRDAWATIHAVLTRVRHDQAGQAPHDWAAAFDRAAEISPEASVALYSLGNAALLAEATDELVACLAHWNLLAPDHRVLDLGCGIGRCLPGLAARSRFVIGTEVSPRMIAFARARCASVSNVGLLLTSGFDLAAIADGTVDLVLAVDVFPYIVQSGAGMPERHIDEVARILRRPGDLVIFNFSYRGDLALDRRDMMRLAQRAGLAVMRNGSRDCVHWDGLAFHLRKA